MDHQHLKPFVLDDRSQDVHLAVPQIVDMFGLTVAMQTKSTLLLFLVDVLYLNLLSLIGKDMIVVCYVRSKL